MREARERFIDWSVGSIIGNIAWGAFASVVLFFFNKKTGCIRVVLDSMRGHELELAGWTIAFALFGALIGLVVRHRIAIGQLAAKDAEIERVGNEANSEADLAEMRRKVNEGDYYARVDLRILAEDGTITLMWVEPDSEVTFYDMFEDPKDANFLSIACGNLSFLRDVGAVEFRRVSGWDREWSLTDAGEQLIDRYPDVIQVKELDVEATRGRMEEIA